MWHGRLLEGKHTRTCSFEQGALVEEIDKAGRPNITEGCAALERALWPHHTLFDRVDIYKRDDTRALELYC